MTLRTSLTLSSETCAVPMMCHVLSPRVMVVTLLRTASLKLSMPEGPASTGVRTGASSLGSSLVGASCTLASPLLSNGSGLAYSLVVRTIAERIGSSRDNALRCSRRSVDANLALGYSARRKSPFFTKNPSFQPPAKRCIHEAHLGCFRRPHQSVRHACTRHDADGGRGFAVEQNQKSIRKYWAHS